VGTLVRCIFYLFVYCFISFPSFCGKSQPSALCSKVSQKHIWPPVIEQTKEPILGVQGHRIIYNEALFGPSVVGKKLEQQGRLKKSPPSNNLFRDSHTFETSKAHSPLAISREASSSESSPTSTPKNFTPPLSEKKEGKQSGLKKSPPSDNLFRDSNDFGMCSSRAQEMSFPESSHLLVSESPAALLTPVLITAVLKRTCTSDELFQRRAPRLRVIIPEKPLKQEDKPCLIYKGELSSLIEHTCVPR